MRKKEDKREDTDSAIIADLSHAIEDFVSGCKKSEDLEGIIDEAKTLAGQWKNPYSAKDPKYRRPLFDGMSGDRTLLLAGLVVALKRDHNLLEQIRRRFPNELEKLDRESRYADAAAAPFAWARAHPKPTGSQKRWQQYESKRGKYRRNFYNSIEYQFGGGLEADLQKGTALSLPPPDPSYYSIVSQRQNCLDDILARKPVNMQGLEDLFFGIDRHQLGKLVDGQDKKDRKYGYRSVVKIMKALLLQKPRDKRKRAKPGRPPPKPWLNGDNQRAYVLAGIAARICGIAAEGWKRVLNEKDAAPADACERKLRKWQKEIAGPFLDVARDHLPASGKK